MGFGESLKGLEKDDNWQERKPASVWRWQAKESLIPKGFKGIPLGTAGVIMEAACEQGIP